MVLEFWIKTPVNKKVSNPLMLTNLNMAFSPCVFNLIWKWFAKDLEKNKKIFDV
jgi:hypothetical protein